MGETRFGFVKVLDGPFVNYRLETECRGGDGGFRGFRGGGGGVGEDNGGGGYGRVGGGCAGGGGSRLEEVGVEA